MHEYTAILREELIPATGCTEPIAIAYCAALVRRLLPDEPQRVEAVLSGNMIKNVKSVVVPNTDGMKGIEAAAAAGIVKFQIVGSHVLTGQQGLGHAVISAGAGVGRVEVAPADMGVDDQILRLAFNGQIVGGEHLLLDGLQPLLVGIKDQTGTGVYPSCNRQIAGCGTRRHIRHQ